MRHYIFVFALLLCSALVDACATKPIIQPPAKVVIVYKDRYVPMPAEFTEPCDIPSLPGHSAKAIVRTNDARLAALLKCDAQKANIREKQGRYVDGQ